MVDKIASIPRSKLGEWIGRLDPEDLVRVNRAVIVFLGLASAARRRGT
jgi:mRNA interferase MazF